jgi:hypothetical protein
LTKGIKLPSMPYSKNLVRSQKVSRPCLSSFIFASRLSCGVDARSKVNVSVWIQTFIYHLWSNGSQQPSSLCVSLSFSYAFDVSSNQNSLIMSGFGDLLQKMLRHPFTMRKEQRGTRPDINEVLSHRCWLESQSDEPPTKRSRN